MVNGVLTADGREIRRRRRGPHHRHLPERPHPYRRAEDPSRPHQRGAGARPLEAALRPGPAHGPAQDRHPAAPRRPHHRLGRPPGAAGRRPAPALLLPDRDASPRRRSPATSPTPREATHAIIAANLDRAPMYSGAIESVGPRYCPSIEDKVVRFKEREQPPDLPRARGPRRRHRLSERHLDLASRGRAARLPRDHPGARSTRASCGPATPSNTTMSIRAS